MKSSIFMPAIASVIIQSGLIAQPAPQLEVDVRQLPRSTEGSFYDNSYQNTYTDDPNQVNGPNQTNGQYRPASQANRQRPAAQSQNYSQQPAQYPSTQSNPSNGYSARRQTYSRSANSSQNFAQDNRNFANQPQSSMSTTQNTNQQPVQQRAERTLAIIKPDAVSGNHIGEILSRFEQSGLRIAGIKMANLSKEQASQFYQVHRDRPFYPELVDFMSSGPVIVLVLEGDNAIAKNRQIIGATDPKKASPGTIRADFAESVGRNAIHGSDSPEAAQTEIFFFFRPNELYTRY